MVVAGAGGNDAERNVGFGEGLQRVGDHPVAADDDQRVGAVVDRGVQQAARVFGVAADDRGDVDAALLQAGDRFLGGVWRVAVS